MTPTCMENIWELGNKRHDHRSGIQVVKQQIKLRHNITEKDNII